MVFNTKLNTNLIIYYFIKSLNKISIILSNSTEYCLNEKPLS